MQIGRFSTSESDKIGKFTDETVIDITDSFNSFSEALSNPEKVTATEGDVYERDDINFKPPISNYNTIYCAALNYEAHAEESNSAIPERPLIFLKLPQSLIGHREPIQYHTRVTQEIDYEAELAVVIGTHCRHVTPADALDYVAGYTILNDISARDLQLSLAVGDDTMFDWFSGKSMRHTTPVGPYVVVNEIADPQNLAISSRVNGETLQDDNTGNMIYSVADLVSYISTRVQLQPGDIIATGTPEGVGTFQDIKLDPGDTVDVFIEDIGTLTNEVSITDS